MDLLTTLKSMDTSTAYEHNLIHFMLNQPQLFLEMKPGEIAGKVYISVATLYRFIDKLGYNGITQFKIAFAASLRSATLHPSDTVIDVDYPINPTDSYREISDNLFEIYQKSGRETQKTLDYDVLLQSVETLANAQDITIYTSSSNIYFARNFKFQMQEIGRFVEVPEDEFTQHIHAANSTGKSAAIVISYGGRSKALLDVLSILKENKTFIILISSTQSNPFTHYADSILYLASSENHYDKISSFSSRFSLLYIFDLIYSGIFTLDYDKHRDYKKTNYQKSTRI